MRFKSFIMVFLSVTLCFSGEISGAGEHPKESFGLHLSHYKFTQSEKLNLVSLANELGSEIVRYNVPIHTVDFDFLDCLIRSASKETQFLLTILHSRFRQPHFCSHLPGPVQQYFTAIKSRLQREKIPINRIDWGTYEPCTPDHYVQMLRKLVRRFKDRVKYWQIENEVYYAPNAFWLGTKEDYVALLNLACRTIKSEDPEAKVLMAGIAVGALDHLPPVPADHFLLYTLRNGNYDIVDVHLYYKYQLIPQRLTYFHDQVKWRGPGKIPIWVTELGGPDMRAYGLKIWRWGKDPEIPLDPIDEMALQAKEVVVRFMMVFGNGVEKAFWHSPYVKSTRTFWSHMALTYRDKFELIRRPAFYTYRMMVEKLGGFEEVIRIADGQYKVKVEDKWIFVLWSDQGEKTVDLSLHFPAGKVRVSPIVIALDRDKNPVFASPLAEETRAVPVGPTPVFVESG